MYNIKWSMLIACFFFSLTGKAQNDADALRYSMVNWGSTARSLGMANSFGALGADLSVMATNPAGLGFYRRSEFSFSPTFTLRTTESDFIGNTIDKNNFKFSFGNFGVEWARTHDNEKRDWKGWSLGIGYNRLNDFNSRTNAEGTNKDNSMIDSHLEQWLDDQTAFDELPATFPFDVNLSWETLLIDSLSDSTGTYIYSAIPGGGALQRRTTVTKGGMGEWDIAFATNYMDKIYIGATVGFVSVDYREDVTWEETDADKTIDNGTGYPDFKSYKYTQSLKTEGSGINLKIGIIYRPTDYLRLGMAIHTPTFLSLTDDYKTTMISEFEQGGTYEMASPDFIPFEYTVITPFRAIGSIGIVVGKYGLIGMEYEYLDYANMEMDAKDEAFSSDFIAVNNTIQSKYTTAHNFRAGGELRYEKLRFRLGGGYYATPFASGLGTSSDNDQSRMSVNGGFGIREKNFSFDVGYSYTQSGLFARQYELATESVPGFTYKSADQRLMFSFGFNF